MADVLEGRIVRLEAYEPDGPGGLVLGAAVDPPGSSVAAEQARGLTIGTEGSSARRG